MEKRTRPVLTGPNQPKVDLPRPPAPSTITEKTLADFTRVAEQTGILKPSTKEPADGD